MEKQVMAGVIPIQNVSIQLLFGFIYDEKSI